MAAELLMRERLVLSLRAFVDIVIWKLRKPLAWQPTYPAWPTSQGTFVSLRPLSRAAPSPNAQRRVRLIGPEQFNSSSSKCKVVHAHTRDEKFNCRFPISDLFRLSYQLIHPRLADGA